MEIIRQEIKELRESIAIGNTFDYVEIKQHIKGYLVIFKRSETSFYLCRQQRKDRKYKDGLRVFKTIDTTVKNIRDIGYKGMIVIGENDNGEFYRLCYKTLKNMEEVNLDLLRSYLSKADS